MAIAVAAREWGSVLEAGLAIASVPLGALLGVFSLGTLTQRVDERAALCGMGVGLAAILYVTFATSVAWSWYVAVGATTTFCVGWAASFVFGAAEEASA
jgi:SSS family solute:Na+ symporter